jgi:H+/Cl- antiporter ClcA
MGTRTADSSGTHWLTLTATTVAVSIASGLGGMALKMPLTAIVLIFEFTRVVHDFVIPVSPTVAGSISVFQLYAKPKQCRSGTCAMRVSRSAPKVQV